MMCQGAGPWGSKFQHKPPLTGQIVKPRRHDPAGNLLTMSACLLAGGGRTVQVFVVDGDDDLEIPGNWLKPVLDGPVGEAGAVMAGMDPEAMSQQPVGL